LCFLFPALLVHKVTFPADKVFRGVIRAFVGSYPSLEFVLLRLSLYPPRLPFPRSFLSDGRCFDCPENPFFVYKFDFLYGPPPCLKRQSRHSYPPCTCFTALPTDGSFIFMIFPFFRRRVSFSCVVMPPPRPSVPGLSLSLSPRSPDFYLDEL